MAFDATPVISGRTGVARYTSSLLEGLRAAGIDVRPFAIGRGPFRPPAGTRHLRAPLRIVQQGWRLGLPPRAETLTGPVDLVHSTDLMLPPTRLPLVATVHDTAALENPALHARGVVHNAAERMRQLHRATVVIANSSSTAEAVRSVATVGELVVVPMFPFPLPPPPEAPPVPGPYLLSVGEITDRKDHVTLVRAFAAADVGSHRLVIAGPPGSAQSALDAEIDGLGLRDRVVLLGLVSDETLSGLYAGATALVLASRQEGFGIPLVEAMQRAIPIVATDLPAVREVAQPGALLVPPGDVHAMVSAIETIVRDAGVRERLAALGRQRAHDFSLERTVAGTVAAYARALELAR